MRNLRKSCRKNGSQYVCTYVRLTSFALKTKIEANKNKQYAFCYIILVYNLQGTKLLGDN